MSASSSLPPALAGPVARLRRDLDEIFGARLQALVAHGPCVRATPGAARRPPLSTLAIVDDLSYKDLAACAQRSADWRGLGVAVPLLLGRQEFGRSLDAFPVEYGDIIAHHVVLAGDEPFAGVAVRDEDLRRTCESWGKAHLFQLREGFIEAGGNANAVARLIMNSASPFAALLAQIVRLRGQNASAADALARATEGIANLPAGPVRQVLALDAGGELDGDTAMSLFPAYLDVAERLAQYLDGWTRG